MGLALTACGAGGPDSNEVIVPISAVYDEPATAPAPPAAAAGAETPAAQPPGTPTPDGQPTALPTPAPAATPTVVVTRGADQMPHSDTPASGEYVPSTIALPPTAETAKQHRYLVHVETSLGLDADEVARDVHAILTDPRGWANYKGNQHSFELVSEPARAALEIYVASPESTDKLCAPLRTNRTWDCRNGNRVIVNSDRWLYMTPTYTDLPEYRAYLINHEVGHFIGLGHADCPKAGANAPVMLQQSMRLQGCTPNAWPAGQG